MPVRLDQIPDEEEPTSGSTGALPVPGALPPQIAAVVQSQLPAGQPYLSSVTRGGARVSFPKPRADIERELAIHERKLQAQEEAKARQLAVKRQAEIQQQMANLKRAMSKVNVLFDEAETKLPAIQDTGFGLRTKQAGRVISNLAGERETAKGFRNTFPIEARKQLKELEKGGRFTDQDIQQMLQAISPQDLESAEARTAKRQQLLKSFQDEYDLYASELQQFGNQAPNVDTDQNIQQLQQQFPGAKIRRKD